MRKSAEQPKTPRRSVHLPPLTKAKVELYRAVRAGDISKTELARRLGWHGLQVDRLLDLRHRSAIDQIERAPHVLGKRLVIDVEDVA
ncbi:MAG TPA: hypothetical protein VJ770_18440 [Stellaceae bacterium]|nr:hypothetical protein [Stellaceae bacterium]